MSQIAHGVIEKTFKGKRREMFKQLRKHGAYAAFKAECLRQRDIGRFEVVTCISQGFSWEDAPEGHDYWSEVCWG